MNIHKINKNKITSNGLSVPQSNHLSSSKGRVLSTPKKRQDKLQTKGFTIIEVVLVLAIAGLIFLMVFVALPALQRSQRDAQRKNDMSLFVDALNRYAANNRGRYPGVTDVFGGKVSSSYSPEVYNFALNYLEWPGREASAEGKTFTDPSTGAGYTIWHAGPYSDNVSKIDYHSINYDIGIECPPSGQNPSERDGGVLVWMNLEGGGSVCTQVR